MWTCPRCKHSFYNRNQAHSCGHFTVQDFEKGKSEISVRLFHLFLEKYREIGDYELHPVKTRVALLTKIRFAAVNRLAKDSLEGHFVLTAAYPDDTVIFKIDNLNNRFFVHHFRLSQPADINKALLKYMRLAYAVGQREHIMPQKKGREDN